MNKLLAILMLTISVVVHGQEPEPTIVGIDRLGVIDEKLVGVWEMAEERSIIRMHLRPDGIGIWNADLYGDESIYQIWVSRYGAENGYLAIGRATNFHNEEPGGGRGSTMDLTGIWKMMKPN